MDLGIFDNFEEDGQLTLFGIEEELEELQASARERAARAGKRVENPPEEETRKAAGRRPEEETRKAAGRRLAEEMQGTGPEEQPAREKPEKQIPEARSAEKQIPEARSPGQQSPGQESDGIRIRSCCSCGKLLFVKEEEGSWHSECNACGIQYMQAMK